LPRDKLIVIGLDGGDLDLILKWRNYLPNFSHILNKGFYGRLNSTIPSITCPAWPSMFTGLNPGQLGMYYWVDMLDTFKVFSYNDWKAKAIWTSLNKEGVSTGLFGIPVTYPVGALNGYIVSGLGTPYNASNFYYPEVVSESFSKSFRITPPVILTKEGCEEKYRNILLQDLEEKLVSALYLLEHNPCDLHINVFGTTDLISHYFYDYKNVVKVAYRLIDNFIGIILEKYDNILIVSDHGFTKYEKGFAINKWLESLGWLYYKETRKCTSFKYVLRDILLGKLSTSQIEVVSRIIPTKLKNSLSVAKEEAQAELNLIDSLDFDKTIAYSTGISGAIYLLDKTYEGRLILELEKVGFKVHRRKDIYFGSYVDKAPDLVVEQEGISFLPLNKYSEGIWDKPAVRGMHKRQGILLGIGSYFNQYAEQLPREINEVCTIISDYFNIEHNIVVESSSSTDLSKQDDLRIKDVLKKLGYLD